MSRGLAILLSLMGVVASTVVMSGTAEAAVPLWEIQSPPGFQFGCLDIKTEDPPSNAQLQLWHCSGGDEQRFRLLNASAPGMVEIVDARNENCLAVPPPNQFTLRADLKMMPCTVQPNQLWTLETSGGYTTIRQVGSQFCLDRRDAGVSDGTHIQQWTCTGNPAQKWRFFSHS
ncbi:RICIN domain-containing protein [Cryptosporangium sp. NPDC051539]|uniref:RICIN domain-containing protein n=1 Tax=Cryptosporangium sp. NPDC051539 TaxID=3363962 RepID=UPI0037AF675A